MDWANAIFNGVTSLFTGVGNMQMSQQQLKAQREMNERNIAFQKETNAENKEFALDMWNRNNAYNSPAMQMQRFKEAGLNPHLIYGQGTPGNSSPTQYAGKSPEVQAEVGSTNFLRELGMQGFQARQNYLAQRNLEASTNVAKADEKLKLEQLAEQVHKTAWTKQQKEQAAALQSIVIQKAMADLNYTNESVKLVTENIKNAISTRRLTEVQTKKFNKEIDSIAQQMYVAGQQIKLMQAEGRIKEAQFRIQQEELKLKKYEATLRDKYGIQSTDNMILRELKMLLPDGGSLGGFLRSLYKKATFHSNPFRGEYKIQP